MPNGNNGNLEQLLEQSPLMKSGLKRVQKNQDTQIDEAMQQGVSAEQILQQLIKKAPTAFSQGGLQYNQQGQPSSFTMPGWFADLFTPGGARGLQELAISPTVQKVTGTEPLQPKDVAGIQIDILKETNKLSQEGLLSPDNILTKFETAAKPFEVARDAQARIEAMQTGTGYDDLGLIFSFMKVLDPGSVVRESEFANAAQAASFLNRTYGKIVKFTSGGRLAPESRKELVDSARRIFKSSERQMGKTTQQFKDLAVRNRINPEAVIRDVGLTLPKTSENIGQQIINKTKSGNTYRRLQ